MGDFGTSGDLHYLHATTSHTYNVPGARTTPTLGQQTDSGSGARTVSVETAIGSSTATASSGSLKLGVQLLADAPGAQNNHSSTIRASAKFTDRVTFDFGDSGLHDLSVPVYVTGDVAGSATSQFFQTRFEFSGDFSHLPAAYNTTLSTVLDNVTSPSGTSDDSRQGSVAGAIATWQYTRPMEVNGSFSRTFQVRSGATYDVYYELYTTMIFDGQPELLDLTHTLRAGPYSGAGLRSVTSANEGVLRAAAGGGFGYAVAAVPEPASWIMLTIGFGMVGGAVRRTRAQRMFITELGVDN